MPFDYKKEYKEFYMPPKVPGIITIPSMNYVAVRGQGDPNEEEGEYKQAIEEATKKKKKDFSKIEFFTYEEGVCVQCMHIGTYDEEPATIERMEVFAKEQGYETDMDMGRYHHEIYLSDPRRCAPEKLKTVIRHPIHKPAF